MIPRLKNEYEKKIINDLQKRFSMRNKHMVPKFFKVVLNMGLGLDGNDKKKIQNCIEDMSLIGGQIPIVTKFKKSISNFKTRKGSNAGVKVTLRSNKMYEFIDRLVNIALPRIKDFQGLSVSGFDNFGNYSFGIKEHIIFPEINFDKVDRIRGMDVTIVTSGEDKKSTHALLQAMNFPFNKKLEKKAKKVKQVITQKKEEKKVN
jgi:large subunit ribosomal protein L5